MSKRSTRMAKRNDFQKADRAVEEAIGTAGKNPAAVTPDRPSEVKEKKPAPPSPSIEAHKDTK